MNFYNTLGILIPNIVSNYILIRFFHEVFKEKYSRNIYIILYFSAVFIQVVITYLKIPILSLGTFSVIAFIIALFAYENTTKNKIMYTITCIIYLSFIDMVIVPLFAIISDITVADTINDNKFYFITGVVSAILGLCTYKPVIRIFVKHSVTILTRSQEIIIFFLGCFELWMVHAISNINNYDAMDNKSIIIGGLIGFLFIDAYIITLFESISRNNELRLKNQLLLQKQLMDKRYYEELEKQNEKYRRIMHDIKKHINVIKQTQKVDDTYCNETLELIDKQGYRFKCTNPILNIIINDKILSCEEKGIKIELIIDDLDWSFMKKVDIVTIFLNLIDNAIEACNEIPEESKWILIKIKEVQSYIVVSITNSISKDNNYREGVSSKKNHMGLGLSNIRSTLEKYDSELGIECSEKQFEAKFFICREYEAKKH